MQRWWSLALVATLSAPAHAAPSEADLVVEGAEENPADDAAELPHPEDAAEVPATADRVSTVVEPSPPKASAPEDDSAPEAAPPEDGDDESYAWQLLMIDAMGIGAGLFAVEATEFRAGDRPPNSGLVGGVWYGVGGVFAPAVHHAHGRTAAGFASFGTRLLLPPLSGAIGAGVYCLGNALDSNCASEGFVGGSLVGLAGSAVLDAAAFANLGKPEPAEKKQRWYGGSLLIMDGAAIGTGVVLAATVRSSSGERTHPSVAVWVPAYLVGFFGGPIIHFAHGNVGKGFASFGLRAGAGALGVLPGLMGYCAATGGTDGCTGTGALWGLTGGLLAMAIVDDFVLAYDAKETSEATRPQLVVGPGSVALVGRF